MDPDGTVVVPLLRAVVVVVTGVTGGAGEDFALAAVAGVVAALVVSVVVDRWLVDEMGLPCAGRMSAALGVADAG